ncbi:MAG TPA: EAL domain-containing protein, partial [Iamia sp.]
TCVVLVTGGVACWLVADVGFLLADGGGAERWLDAGWMAALLLLAAATGSRSPEPTADPEPFEVRMWAVMIPLLVPGLFELQGFLAGEDPNPIPALTATAVLIVLVAIRGHRLTTDLRATRRVVESRERHFQTLAVNAADAVVVLDAEGHILEGASQLARLLSYDETMVEGASALDRRALVDEPAVRALLERALVSPGVVSEDELRIRHGNGETRWLAARVLNRLDDPDVCGIVVNLQDISDRKRMEEQLAHQAFHDPLTGLANRALVIDRIEHSLQRGSRTGTDPAVIYLDVDGFKTVNDRLGHEAGDSLLRQIADRLVATVRAEDTVARLGGDEFAILVEENHAQADEARTTAERILQAMGIPLQIEDELIAVSASIGVAVANPRSTTTSLLRDADVAMYRAKASGKAQVVVYDLDMGTEAGETLQIEADLARAVERGELELFYQPVVDLANERVVGFEALLRWWHPRLGLVLPDRFIPVAEKTGLIVPIGRWVLETACATAARWQQSDPNGTMTMAINVSARQFASDDIVDDVARALSSSGLDPQRLVLELTETALVADPEQTAQRLHHLHDLGAKLAIDDFGTGFSSLSYLRQFPVDILKIDRSFIETITDDTPLPPIVRGLLDLGHTLDLEIVAEGIELDVQRTGLRDQSCGLGQGFLFSRPLPAADAERLLDQPLLDETPP